MARVWNEHGGEPVNEGERRVVVRLAKELPDEFVIIPSIQIPYRLGDVHEIDAIVLTPFAVVVVEIKDYRGSVVFEEQRHVVNDEERPNPIRRNGIRARQLKGKLRDASGDLKWIWVADQVVLAREPKELLIDEAVVSKVTTLGQAARRLADPQEMLPPHVRRQPLDVDAVLQALRIHGQQREEVETYGGYTTTALIERTDESRLYEAYEQLDVERKPVLLRVHVIDRFLSPDEQETARNRAMKGYEALHHLRDKVGGVPQVVGPTDRFPTESGDIVIISPLDTGISLADLADTRAQ